MSLLHPACSIFCIFLPCSILTSDFLFCYLFHLGNGPHLSVDLLSNYQTLSLGVPCCELAYASTKLGRTADLAVCSSYRPPFSIMPWLLGQIRHTMNEMRRCPFFSHFINIPWEILVNINIRMKKGIILKAGNRVFLQGMVLEKHVVPKSLIVGGAQTTKQKSLLNCSVWEIKENLLLREDGREEFGKKGRTQGKGEEAVK